MKKPLQIGLTGGIGSGKSTVAKIFEALHVPVYYADDRSKFILQNNEEVKSKIISLWGAKVLDDNQQINKAALAGIVFKSDVELKKLNALLHPLVALDYSNWLEEQNSAFVVKEAAILIESGSYKTCDKIIVVNVPVEVAIERVMRRDRVSEEQVKARMSKQLSQEERLKFAHFVVQNDGNKMLIPQVLEIYKTISSS